MQERNVSLGTVISVGLWVLSFGFILCGTVVGVAAGNIAVCVALCAHGLAFAAGAATATVRGYFASQNQLLRGAFELGQNSAMLRQVKGN